MFSTVQARGSVWRKMVLDRSLGNTPGKNLHRFTLPLLHERARFLHFRARLIVIPDHFQNGRRELRAILLTIKIEKPVSQSAIAPHETFAGLLFETTDDRGHSIADAHDGRVHFQPKEPCTAKISAERLVGEPKLFAPNDAFTNVVREKVQDPLPAHFHLALILRANKNFMRRFANHSNDGLAQRCMILISH